MKNQKEIYLYVLGGAVFFSAIAVIILLFFKDIPSNNRDIVNVSIGTILTMAGAVIGYFFGSSKGSADKNQNLKTNSDNTIKM